MKRSHPSHYPWLLLVLLAIARGAVAGEVSARPVLDAMSRELTRSMAELSRQPEPPFFLSYEVTERHRADVDSLFGQLEGSSEQRWRQLDIDLRVGTPQLDNTHPLRGGGRWADGGRSFVELPVEDDPAALESALWFHTDRTYKRAVEQLTQARADVQVKVEREDTSADFAPAPAQSFAGTPAVLRLERAAWEPRLRRYTAPFAAHGHVYDARASLQAEAENRWYVNSEGTRLFTSRLSYQLSVSAFTKADDGMELPRFETFFAYSLEELPDDATVLAAVARMIADLEALRTAPVVEPYSGPAVLSGRATGVFFHEVFGHRIEGHRLKREDDSQTFKSKLGEQILPASFSLVFDPTIHHLDGHGLAGFYRFDNEGVAARPVTVVEDGVLRGFLMARSPIAGFPESNGHGRREAGFAAVARQSNLIVRTGDAVPRDQLRHLLLERIRAEGKAFGLWFEDVQGGFTLTGRAGANAFNVLPILVYRVYADGREELVRGVDLIGTPLTVFSKIVAAGDQLEVFNGVCGAESGGVPVAAAAPAILIAEIEVQKKAKSQERLPLLPPPGEEVTP